MRGLHELLTAKFFNIDPNTAAGYRRVLEQNLNGHTPFLGTEKVIGRKISALTGAVIEDTRISTESGMEVSRYNDNQDDPFINVLIINGPMTRNGDMCSYGSIDHRDMIISAANNANCVGHLFIVNTPGGTAWTHNDYQQAIDYAHSKQQPVVMWIDGICMSAGMYLASMCDEIYYMHPKDEVGCIGTMAMFYTMKNGDKDFNGETYHELYDPESFNKNQEFRDIAENGDDKLLVDELAELGKEFRDAITTRFPKAKDDMIHGKTFYAEKVKGVFLNGQTDLGGAFNRTITLAKKMGNTAATNASSVSLSGAATGATATAVGATASNQNNQTQKNMNKHYQNVASLLGIDELAVKTNSDKEIENGSFLNIGQLDKMDAAIADLQSKVAKQDETQKALDKANTDLASLQESKKTYEKQIADLQNQISGAKANSEQASKDAATDKQKALDEQKAASDKQIAELNAKIADMEKAAKAANTKIAELEQSVKDKDAQIEELSKDPGNEPAAGAAPENNGEGAEQTQIVASEPVYDRSKSYAENMRIIGEWRKNHKK